MTGDVRFVRTRARVPLCVVCRDALSEVAAARACPGCQAHYHEECAATLPAHCATLGCGRELRPATAWTVAPPAPAAVDLAALPPPRWSDEVDPGLLVLALLFVAPGALFLVLLAPPMGLSLLAIALVLVLRPWAAGERG